MHCVNRLGWQGAADYFCRSTPVTPAETSSSGSSFPCARVLVTSRGGCSKHSKASDECLETILAGGGGNALAPETYRVHGFAWA